MNNYIAFLRGINVGGNKKIQMADLKILFEKNNFKTVKTYIQSGNVIFQSNKNNTNTIAQKLEQVLQKQYGFSVSVIVKTKDEILQILEQCPFSEIQIKKSYFIFLKQSPSLERMQNASKIQFPGEHFLITPKCVYLYCENGYARAKCNTNFFEKKLETIATARNYNTLQAIIKLV